jgi:phosphonopyruvate decarboxylase
VTGREFAALLERRGFDFFAGVPCSLIEDLIAALESHPRLPYIDAVREDVAVGLAGGAWLAGRRPAVLMQNSGLGTSLNALASFALMYGLPALLLVTWRGFGGQDAPEHILMGEISPRLLDLLGIPYHVLARDSLEADVAWAREQMDARMSPVALLVPPGLFHSEGASSSEGGFAPLRSSEGTAPSEASPRTRIAPAKPALEVRSLHHAEDRPLVARISRMQAIAAAIKQLGDEPAIHANGYPSRESCAIADRPQNFYMIGSMGLASAIGLGVALGRPQRRTIVFDGDGNLLMNLGIIANATALAPPNFIHCVLDNEAYGSTGNQRSASAHVRLDRVARAAGYRTVAAVTEADEVAAALRTMLSSDGPHFLLVKVTREQAKVPRIPHTPPAIRDRFRATVLGT